MKLKEYFIQPMDNSPLIVFRMFFGLLMFFEAIGALITGWVTETFVDVNFTFHFIGFDFLQAFVGPQMYGIYFMMAICGLFITFGLFYRWSIVLFTLLWSITYLNQKTHYNNHYYLVMLIGFIMCLLPANTYASQDVKYGFVKQQLTMPKWVWLVIALQMSMVYVYASIAKFYPDWLVAKPIELWFTRKSYEFPMLWSSDFAVQLKQFFSQSWIHYVFAYTGILFDLLVIPMFLWNKWTRWTALILSLIFHLTNSAIFQIGVFPYFALAFVVFFFKPETIRRRFLKHKPKPNLSSITHKLPRWVIPVFGAYLFIQLILPLRQYVMPSTPLWDETAHRLSWRMMLRTKTASTTFYILEKGSDRKKKVSVMKYIKKHQYGDLLTKPDVQWQFVQKLKSEYMREGKDISVFVDSKLSINGRPKVQFTDPSVDVAAVSWNFFGPQKWVLEPNITPILQQEEVK